MPTGNDRPSWLDRAAALSGTAVRLTARALDEGVRRAANTLADAEQAFREGRDSNVEDAKVLEERDREDGPDGAGRQTADRRRRTS
jgi:hypothetical protein